MPNIDLDFKIHSNNLVVQKNINFNRNVNKMKGKRKRKKCKIFGSVLVFYDRGILFIALSKRRSFQKSVVYTQIHKFISSSASSANRNKYIIRLNIESCNRWGAGVPLWFDYYEQLTRHRTTIPSSGIILSS